MAPDTSSQPHRKAFDLSGLELRNALRDNTEQPLEGWPNDHSKKMMSRTIARRSMQLIFRGRISEVYVRWTACWSDYRLTVCIGHVRFHRGDPGPPLHAARQEDCARRRLCIYDNHHSPHPLGCPIAFSSSVGDTGPAPREELRLQKQHRRKFQVVPQSATPRDHIYPGKIHRNSPHNDSTICYHFGLIQLARLRL